jgi:WD40 repeat protein/uncharacterized caspase-like protein
MRMAMLVVVIVTVQIHHSLASRDQASGSGATGTIEGKPQLMVQLGHSDILTSVAFSRDGNLIITGSWDSSAIVWDAKTGREIRRFKHPGRVEYVDFFPDGKIAITGSGSGSHLWDISTGKQIRLFKEHSTGGELFTSFALSPDGRFILTGDWQNNAVLWDAATGKEIRRFRAQGAILAVRFSPDSQFVLTGWSNNAGPSDSPQYAAGASLWDIRTGQEVRRFRLKTMAVSVAFSADGSLVAIGTGGAPDNENSAVAHVYSIATGRELQRFGGHTGQIKSVAFSPTQHHLLATGDNSGTTRLWDINTGKEVRSFKEKIVAVSATAFSPDGRMIVSGGNSHSARLWDVDTGDEIHHLRGISAPVHGVAISPDNRFIAVGVGAGEPGANAACLWDTATGSEAQRFKHSSPVDTVVFSPGGDLLAVAGNDQSAGDTDQVTQQQTESGVRLWNVYTAQQIHHFKSSGTPVAFSPNGNLIAMGDSGSNLFDMCIRSAATGKLIKRFFESVEEVGIASAAFSPDGRFIVTGEAGQLVSGVMVLWNTTTGRRTRVFKPTDVSFIGNSSFPTVAFSPDGRFLLGGGRLWDAVTAKERLKLTDRDRKALILKDTSGGGNLGQYSPDGRLVATDDGEDIVIWDSSTGQQVKRLVGHLRYINSIAFSPDGRFILSGAEDGTARIWEVSTGNELCRLISLNNGDWVVVAPDGRFDTNNLEDIRGLSWVMPDDPMKPLPLEIFMRDYYEPRLLARILAGEEFKPVRSLAELNRAQPAVRITKIERENGRADTASVTVEVSGAAAEFKAVDRKVTRQAGVYDVRLFRDGQLVGQAPREELVSGSDAKRSKATGDEELSAWRNRTQVKMDSTGRQTIKFENIKLPRKVEVKQVEFSGYCFNEDRVKSQTDRKPFLIPGNLQPRKGRAYLITVGVNAYENRAFDLKYSVNDARLIQKTVFDKLAKTGEYAEIVQAPLISDSKKVGDNREVTENTATKQNFKAVLDVLAGRPVDPETKKKIPNADKLQTAQPEDLILISFSCHGYADADGNFYFVLSDTGPSTGEQVTEELLQKLSANFLSSEELSLWLRDVDAGEMLMIVDACHSAAAVQGKEFKPGPMGSRGLGQLSYDKGMRILTATQAADVAYGIGALKQGLLTYVLVKDGIEAGKADFKPVDRRITVAEWLQYGEGGVPKLLEDAGKKAKQADAPVELKDLVQKTLSDIKTQRPSLFDFSRKKRDVVLVGR